MLKKIKRISKSKYQEDLNTNKVNSLFFLKNKNKEINILKNYSILNLKYFPNLKMMELYYRYLTI